MAEPPDPHADRTGASPLPIAAIAALSALTYAVLFWLDYPQRSFTPDSWTYFELASSFGSDHPYEARTLRSFWSLTHSASFPPGYPLILHLLHKAVATSPQVAVVLNAAITAATPLAAGVLSARLGCSQRPGHLAGLALVLYLPYMREVVAGRSLPLATLLTILALVAAVDGKRSLNVALAGAAIGAACMVRFDHLSLVALIAIIAWLRGADAKRMCVLFAAWVVTISPWVFLSVRLFGRIWASDNSWVALAAHPAFVTDFPAGTSHTLWSDPVGFAMKCIDNVGLALFALAQSATLFWPSLPLLLASYARFRSARLPNTRTMLLVCGFAVILVLPFVLTGYLDARYFALAFFLATLALLAAGHMHARGGDNRFLRNAVIGVLLHLMLMLAWTFRDAWLRPDSLALNERVLSSLELLDRCHAAEPEVRYVFSIEGEDKAASRYGAMFGRPSALMPRNISLRGDPGLAAFECTIAPLRYVSRPTSERATTCEQMLSRLVTCSDRGN